MPKQYAKRNVTVTWPIIRPAPAGDSRTWLDLSLETNLFNETLSMPVAPWPPVGPDRHVSPGAEVQAAKARWMWHPPLPMYTSIRVCLSRRSGTCIKPAPCVFAAICAQGSRLHEERTGTRQGGGVNTLVFTVDMPHARGSYRDAHSGMSGPQCAAAAHVAAVHSSTLPLDVGLLGKHMTWAISRPIAGNPNSLAIISALAWL